MSVVLLNMGSEEDLREALETAFVRRKTGTPDVVIVRWERTGEFEAASKSALSTLAHMRERDREGGAPYELVREFSAGDFTGAAGDEDWAEGQLAAWGRSLVGAATATAAEAI